MLATLKKLPLWALEAPRKFRLCLRVVRAPYFKWVFPGHFYSPLPDMAEVEERSSTLFAPAPDALPGIELRGQEQARLLKEFEGYCSDPPFYSAHNPRCRFVHPNKSFPFQDAFVLHAMLRHLKPARLIEVGCGFSSCVVLDTCEALKLNTRLTFIEPHPEVLLAHLRPEDLRRVELRQEIIQHAPLELFAGLEAGDILFIDTSHVTKIGGDVNFIFFEILPRLKPGVVVHFHDIFYPFEYPKQWLFHGIFWNEAYLLRAFLMFNGGFEILLFNSYLNHQMPDYIRARFPLCWADPGASLWLRRAGGGVDGA
jgi:predicted O-methyltransferase YrrM